jgi:hypothetical protein
MREIKPTHPKAGFAFGRKDQGRIALSLEYPHVFDKAGHRL